MKSVIKRKITTVLLLCTIIVSTSVSFASAYTTSVHQTVVNSLNVRSRASVNGSVKATLSLGKDVIAGDVQGQQWVTEGSKRLWKTYAYPSLSQGKYTNSVRGWICAIQDNSKYVDVTSKVKIEKNGGEYIHKTRYLNSSIAHYPNGTMLAKRDVPEEENYNAQSVTHSKYDINAWAVHGTSGNIKGWINGWWVNAQK